MQRSLRKTGFYLEVSSTNHVKPKNILYISFFTHQSSKIIEMNFPNKRKSKNLERCVKPALRKSDTLQSNAIFKPRTTGNFLITRYHSRHKTQLGKPLDQQHDYLNLVYFRTSLMQKQKRAYDCFKPSLSQRAMFFSLLSIRVHTIMAVFLISIAYQTIANRRLDLVLVCPDRQIAIVDSVDLIDIWHCQLLTEKRIYRICLILFRICR